MPLIVREHIKTGHRRTALSGHNFLFCLAADVDAGIRCAAAGLQTQRKTGGNTVIVIGIKAACLGGLHPAGNGPLVETAANAAGQRTRLRIGRRTEICILPHPVQTQGITAFHPVCGECQRSQIGIRQRQVKGPTMIAFAAGIIQIVFKGIGRHQPPDCEGYDIREDIRHRSAAGCCRLIGNTAVVMSLMGQRSIDNRQGRLIGTHRHIIFINLVIP